MPVFTDKQGRRMEHVKSFTKTINAIFNIGIIISALILILFSLSAFIIIQKNLFQYEFEFNQIGLNNYLSAFGKFKELFAGTITLIVAYFGILRLKAAEIANTEKIKQDRFNEWKNILETRISEVEKGNPLLKRQIIKIRFSLFEKLYKSNMSINSKTELLNICDDKFKESIRFLEEMNDTCLKKGVYKSKQHTYFCTNFSFVFIGSLDNCYAEIETDFKEIYLNSLDPDRIINEEWFKKLHS